MQTSWSTPSRPYPRARFRPPLYALLDAFISLKDLTTEQGGEWTTSVFLNANLAWIAYTNARGSTYESSVSSALSEVRSFASAHSNYSIPADVTNDDAATTFYSKPDWYDALPTGVKQFKEEQVSDQFSIIRSVIGDGTTSAAGGGTGTGSAGGALPTPRAGLGAAGMGAMAAVAAGVFL
ncbi:hypothetical protein PMIN05_006556 [Paraphaeosphaeria minitans]